MRIGVLTFHRGDRPEFTEQFHRLLSRQTRQPEAVEIVDYPPKDDKVDLTERFRIGYEALSTKVDIIAIMEIDDFYPDIYLRSAENFWEQYAGPDTQLLGWDETIYYHLIPRKYRIEKTPGRSSLMSTIIKADQKINWPPGNTLFLDIHLWRHLKGVTVSGWLAIGVKHGIGKCGGIGHKQSFFNNGSKDDLDMEFFYSFTDDIFYRALSEKLNQ